MMEFRFQDNECSSKMHYLTLSGLGIIAGVLTLLGSFGEINGTDGKKSLLGQSWK